MKPKHIYIYRHGESIGNVDWTNYCKMEDEEIPLSDKGLKQASTAALNLLSNVTSPSIALYSSHFLRALQTADCVKRSFGDRVKFSRVDRAMCELCWAPRVNIPDAAKQSTEREVMKTFDGKNPGGESAREVYDRMDGVIARLEKDFTRPDYPDAAVMVSHGITMRCFLMNLLGWPTNAYKVLKNPHNCQIFVLELDSYGKYKLITPFPVHTIDSK